MAKRSDSRNQPQNYEDNLFLHHLDGNLVELERKFSGFRKGNVSKNHDSFYSHDIHQTNDSVHIHSCFLVGNGFGKKKKMVSDDASQLTAPENASDVEEENELAEKQDDENSQLEHLSAAQSCSTIVGEERTCLSNSEAEDEPSRIILAKFSAEEDRVQMRAKRGHGISRHSLAERIRRERISERMKFLQGLVPGCDKITGKAVVLDEIINYVLSLQHQVEFLSMKLAAIDPRGNCQHCCYLSKDIYHSQGGSATTVDDHEMSFLHSLLINNASTNLWKIS